MRSDSRPKGGTSEAHKIFNLLKIEYECKYK